MKNPKELAVKTGILLGIALAGSQISFDLARKVSETVRSVALDQGVSISLASVFRWVTANSPYAVAIPAIDKVKGILFEHRAYGAMQETAYRDWADVVEIKFAPRWNLDFTWDDRDFTWKEKPGWKHEDEKS